MAIGNEEIVQECFRKHSLMGTPRMKLKMRQTKTVRRDARVWEKIKRTRKKKEVPTA